MSSPDTSIEGTKKRLLTLGWKEIGKDSPPMGVACIVYKPVGVSMATGETAGPLAAAFYRRTIGWVYADSPTPVRFTPAYFRTFKEI